MKDKNWKPTYSEFSDSRLVEIYNTVNPIEGYKDFYKALAKNLSASSIVDIGCGSGLLTCELAKEGYQLIGVEPSKEMLKLARRSPCGGQVKWIEGGVEQLKNFEADLVIMTGHVAQFFLDDATWRTALSSIYNALGPDGYVAFESRNPNVQPFADWPTKASHRKLNDPIVGKIEWWHEMLDVQYDQVKYEIHYLFVEAEEELVSLCQLRFRTQNELRRSLVDTGFIVENIFGDWNSNPIKEDSPEMIFVAKRQ